MADRGFTQDFNWPENEALPKGEVWETFLGLYDRAIAEKYAYRLPAHADDAPESNEDAPWENGPAAVLGVDDPDFLEALLGPSPTSGPDVSDPENWGCLQSSTAALSPKGDAPNLDVLGEIAGESQAAALDADVVSSALSAWRECMSAAGYEVELPQGQDAMSDVSPAAIERAVRDVDCKEASGLIDVYVTTLYSEESKLIAQRREELKAYQDFVDARVSRAQEILAGLPE